eukprot:716208-Rhodomonas_salina.1
MAESGRQCSVCGETKLSAEFSKKQWAAKAHSRKCKACTDGEEGGVTKDMSRVSLHSEGASQSPAAAAQPVITGPMVRCGACDKQIPKKSAGSIPPIVLLIRY